VADELAPILWWVWRVAEPTKRGRVTAVTRAEALLQIAKRNRLELDQLDAEVVRA
jgi:hypothetical protein